MAASDEQLRKLLPGIGFLATFSYGNASRQVVIVEEMDEDHPPELWKRKKFRVLDISLQEYQ